MEIAVQSTQSDKWVYYLKDGCMDWSLFREALSL